MSILSEKYFHSEAAARKKLESIIWPDGPVCPHCRERERIYKIKPKKGSKTRPGLHKCGSCRRQFTVTVGTLFERSHVPLHYWFQALYLMVSSKKGVSAKQLERTLGVTYKTAWFMAHRLREAMRGNDDDALGGINKVVESDETYVGGKAKNRAFKKPRKQEPVVALVEREGKVRGYHLPSVSAKTLRPILYTQVDRDSYLMTDEARHYIPIGREYKGHGKVNHSAREYVRGYFWHTNTVENYFSILKRGITGIYQHVSQQHLKRYIGEFDFRYNTRDVNDVERMGLAMFGIVGKRLMYRDSL